MNPLPWFAALCLVTTLLFAASRPPSPAVAQEEGPTATIAAQQEQIAALQTQVAGLSSLIGTATPASTISPAATGEAGDVLYRADASGGSDDRELPRPRQSCNGMLITDGSVDEYLFARAPFDLGDTSD